VTVKTKADKAEQPKPAETPAEAAAPAPAPAAEKSYSQADLDAAVATATAAGRAEGRTQERARIKGIMTHTEAQGREGLAGHLAYDSDMAVDAAAQLMEKAPKASAGQAAPAGETMMGLELASPVATKTASRNVDSKSVYERRRSA
jgi:hypothetical protein